LSGEHTSPSASAVIYATIPITAMPAIAAPMAKRNRDWSMLASKILSYDSSIFIYLFFSLR
jgi:hypothetical protein